MFSLFNIWYVYYSYEGLGFDWMSERVGALSPYAVGTNTIRFFLFNLFLICYNIGK